MLFKVLFIILLVYIVFDIFSIKKQLVKIIQDNAIMWADIEEKDKK